MDVLNTLPVFIRDFGVFVTVIVAGLFLLAYSPFAFRIEFQGNFLIGRNGRLKEISEVAREDANAA